MARQSAGVVAAAVAAAAFSTSGVLLKPMFDAGWSPAAAVGLRVAVGGVILVVPALVSLQGNIQPSVVGLVLVVNPFRASGAVDGVGVLLAFAAAVCLAGYYLIAAIPTPGLPPLALVSSGLIVGAVATFGVGFIGILPLSASNRPVSLGATSVAWWLPIVLVALVATAAAYSLSLFGARRLGSRVSSFMGLLEVLFATALAWAVLGEQPGLVQLVGGCFVLGGVILVRQGQADDGSDVPDWRGSSLQSC